MKKRNIKRIILSNLKLLFVALAGGIIGSLSVGYAANIYYNGIEVGYDNTTTKMTSTNVQDALDELFDVADVSNRVSTLEGYFGTGTNYFYMNNKSLNLGSTTSGNSGQSFINFYNNGVRTGRMYSSSATTSGSTALTIEGSDPTNGDGKGRLNLQGNPVSINGISIDQIYKIVIWNDNTPRTLNAFDSIYVTPSFPTQTGYTLKTTLNGYGNGNLGIIIYPNQWIYNANNTQTTINSITWILLYEKTF